jgi:hypothetical protein
VRASVYIHLDLGRIGVSLLLLGECLDMTLAGAVHVIGNPGLFLFALAGSPYPLSHRHDQPPVVGGMSQYVAKISSWLNSPNGESI